jgi:RimJ/RimL family protein N-acetyltransferase
MWRQPEVIRYTIGSESPPERTWQRLLAYRGHWAWLGMGYWAVECKSSGQYIGELGFADFHRELPLSVQGLPEIGWALRVESHGRGYAAEAIRKVLQWGDARPGFQTSFCIIHRENHASLHLARKFGYATTVRPAAEGDPRLLLARTVPG